MTASLSPTPALTAEEAARVAVFDAAEEPEEIVVERVARAIAEHTQMLVLADHDSCFCGWKGDRFRRHLATAVVTAMRATR